MRGDPVSTKPESMERVQAATLAGKEPDHVAEPRERETADEPTPLGDDRKAENGEKIQEDPED